MEGLKTKLDAIKKRAAEAQAGSMELKRAVIQALRRALPGRSDPLDGLSEYYLDNGRLVLKAKNKALASELFMKKEVILAGLNQNKDIRELVIK